MCRLGLGSTRLMPISLHNALIKPHQREVQCLQNLKLCIVNVYTKTVDVKHTFTAQHSTQRSTMNDREVINSNSAMPLSYKLRWPFEEKHHQSRFC